MRVPRRRLGTLAAIALLIAGCEGGPANRCGRGASTRAARACGWVLVASRDSLSPRLRDGRAWRSVEIARETTIVVPASPRVVRLATPHPIGSYVLVDEGAHTRLLVLDVPAFWSASRRLVVVVDTPSGALD